jgi:hypothetical protein
VRSGFSSTKRKRRRCTLMVSREKRVLRRPPSEFASHKISQKFHNPRRNNIEALHAVEVPAAMKHFGPRAGQLWNAVCDNRGRPQPSKTARTGKRVYKAYVLPRTHLIKGFRGKNRVWSVPLPLTYWNIGIFHAPNQNKPGTLARPRPGESSECRPCAKQAVPTTVAAKMRDHFVARRCRHIVRESELRHATGSWQCSATMGNGRHRVCVTYMT